MASEASIALLKTDLGFTGKVPDEVQTYMEHLIDASVTSLQGKGIVVEESEPDSMQLLVMHAAYLYRKRINGDPMPQMLRAAINNAIVANATQEVES